MAKKKRKSSKPRKTKLEIALERLQKKVNYQKRKKDLKKKVEQKRKELKQALSSLKGLK